MVTVAIIEDDTLFLHSLSKFFHSATEFGEVSGYASIEDFLQKPPQNPAIILLDIILPGMDGLKGAFEITKQFPDAVILMLSDYEEQEKVLKAFQAGACGYILKSISFKKLKEMVLEALEGGITMSPAIAKMIISHFINPPFRRSQAQLEILTDREMEVAMLLNEGVTYKYVARHLGISMDTVRQHIKNIYRKLQINSRSELMRDFRIS